MLYPKVFGYSIIVAFHVCRLPCQDLMVSRCTKRIREKVTEQEMWVDGEFASEEDMKGELNLNERLNWKNHWTTIWYLFKFWMLPTRLPQSKGISSRYLILTPTISNLKNLRKRIKAIKAECEKRPGWTRHAPVWSKPLCVYICTEVTIARALQLFHSYLSTLIGVTAMRKISFSTGWRSVWLASCCASAALIVFHCYCTM